MITNSAETFPSSILSVINNSTLVIATAPGLIFRRPVSVFCADQVTLRRFGRASSGECIVSSVQLRKHGSNVLENGRLERHKTLIADHLMTIVFFTF